MSIVVKDGETVEAMFPSNGGYTWIIGEVVSQDFSTITVRLRGRGEVSFPRVLNRVRKGKSK